MMWYLFALLSAFFGALAMIFKKKTLFKEHATEFEAILKIFELILTAFLIPFIGISIGISHKTLIFIYLLSVAAAATNIMSSKAFRHMEISRVVPLYNLSPLFVLILAFILLKEKISSMHLLGVLVIIVGMYILEADHSIRDISAPFKKLIHSRYMIIFITAIAISSFGTIGEKFIISKTNPVALLLFIYLFTAFNLTVYHTVMYDGFDGLVKGIKKSGKNIFFVAIFSVLCSLAWFYAISLSLVSLVLPLQKTSTLIATVGGGKLFKEKHLMQKAVACIIMIIGCLLVIL